MLDSLYVAATGMQAQQLNVDTIANNLANVNTVGFKKSRVSFTDLVTRQASAVAAPDGASADLAASPLAEAPAGSGVGIASITRLFEAGTLKQTGSALDVAIRGDGFLEVVLPDGSRAFSRGGSLKVNAERLLVNEAGYALKPGITVPSNATAVAVEADGRVRITVAGQPSPVDAGQLELVRFANAGALVALGMNTYRASEASGEGMPARAGEDGVGTLAQGYLEGSNVQMVDEMVNLMVAQRAYEASVKVIQASDEMLGMVNQLRK